MNMLRLTAFDRRLLSQCKIKIDSDGPYTKFRKDGWPFCPNCGQDFLISEENSIDTIVICEACHWRAPLRRST